MLSKNDEHVVVEDVATLISSIYLGLEHQIRTWTTIHEDLH